MKNPFEGSIGKIKKAAIIGLTAIVPVLSSAKSSEKENTNASRSENTISESVNSESAQNTSTASFVEARQIHLESLLEVYKKDTASLKEAYQINAKHQGEYSSSVHQYKKVVENAVAYLERHGDQKSARDLAKSNAFVDSMQIAIQKIIDHYPDKDLTKHFDQISGMIMTARNPHTGKIIMSSDNVTMFKGLGSPVTYGISKEDRFSDQKKTQMITSNDIEAHDALEKIPRKLIMLALQVNEDKKNIAVLEKKVAQTEAELNDVRTQIADLN